MALLIWSGLLVAAYAPLDGVQWQCTVGSGRGRIDVVVGAGALHESDDARGVAHLLEHLLFRKSNFAYRHENGSTSLDYTHYHRAVDTDLMGAAVSLLQELRRPSFTDEDVTVEREVVIKELEDRGVADTAGPDPLFGTTALARSPGGTARSVRGLRRADALDFHRRYYVKGNLAVRVSHARDCAALEAAVRPLFADWSPGAAAELPAVTEDEPGPIALPGGRFTQGFFWYEASPTERLLWSALGEHLHLRALRVLRQERGLVYTPQLVMQKHGPGGLLMLRMNAGDNAREAARWFDDEVSSVRTEPRVTAHLAEALGRVGQRLDEQPQLTALAAIRGEPAPRTILDRLRKNVPRATLEKMLVERRRFGSTLPQSNVWTLLVLGIFGVGVLAFLAYAAKEILRG